MISKTFHESTSENTDSQPLKLKLGYNTSGFNRSEDIADVINAIDIIGYAGMELTLCERHFHPYCADLEATNRLAQQIVSSELELVLNTGGRYVLSDEAHEPSLCSVAGSERKKFVQFVADTIKLAPILGAKIVMLHSGTLPPEVDIPSAWEWIISEVAYLCVLAKDQGVALAFEFHPNMFVKTLSDYQFLKGHVASSSLGLTLDVGHVVCTDTRPVSQVIEECRHEIVNVHLEDIKGREHVHLPIGHGDIDYSDVFYGLKAIGYRGLINAEFNSNDLEVDECQLATKTFEYLHTLM